MSKNTKKCKFAQIEYHGSPGVTKDCLNSIVRLIHFGDLIVKAKLLSFEHEHCFLLTVNVDDCVAIKAGFSSGYRGEGPRGLSTALQLLDRHGAEIDEYLVPQSIIEDIDDSCLSASDQKKIESLRPVRPKRWYDYVYDVDGPEPFDNDQLQYVFPVEIPFSIIDTRIIDLALKFKQHPDNSIITGFRRLEDIVRGRTKLTGESGQRLFSKAFQGEDSTSPLLE